MTGHLRSLAFVRNKAYASAPERAGHRRIAAVPFTLRNLKADLEDVGSNFDGAPDLEFRLATQALELEKSGLSYQRVPPTNRWRAGATRAGAWRAQESTRRLFLGPASRSRTSPVPPAAVSTGGGNRGSASSGLRLTVPARPASSSHGRASRRSHLRLGGSSETRCAYPRSCARRSAAARAWSTSEVVRRAIEPPTQR